jgi:hypothetical protein
MPKKLISGLVLAALICSLTALGFAQGSESAVKGSLAGGAEDTSGAVVEGAKVTIIGPSGTRSVQTGSDGRFLFQVLTPGSYSVKVEKQGFKVVEIKSAEVVTGRTTSIGVKMEVGASTTTVEVTAAEVTVDTTSTAVASNLTDTFYSSVPVGRGVTSLFYAAPGVASGGGTGTANPSIAGGTGLENNYVADGVSITDGGFGGIGVYSRMYGSLGSGINLSFVKEVQVKTGGFEAQYGKSTGGIVQIVTKSGSDKFHGSVGGYFGPQQFEMDRLFADDFGAGGSQAKFNLQGKILHQSNFDADVQFGGPLLKNHLFFFGSFNPQWNKDYNQFAQYTNPSDSGTGGSVPGGTQTHLGNYEVPVTVYSYAGKGTLRLTDNHQFEVSVFGDPTYGENNANGNFGPQTASTTTFDKLQYGTRNLAARYNGTLSPTWLVNGSFSWGHNNLNDTPASPDTYVVVDRIQRNPCGPPVFSTECTATTNQLRGQFTRQGLGYYENTTGDNYGINGDTSKVFNFLGSHNLTFGYRYDRGHYDGSKQRTGPNIAIDAATAALASGDPDPNSLANAAMIANGTNASFQMRDAGPGGCGDTVNFALLFVPGMTECPGGGIPFYLRQDRGEFGLLNFKTTSRYHTAFIQDAWSPNKYVTINAGLRWEQQRVQGTAVAYTFNDNWSPRVGISVDPWGNRKTKITANFGRYTEALPLDIAIRSLSTEYDFSVTNWTPPHDAAGNALINPDGTLDFSNFSVANNNPRFLTGVSAQDPSNPFAVGTRSQYLDEYVVGFEHEFGNSGVVFSARYTDRRIKRIIEDNAALSPEAYAFLNQNYVISNVNKAQDLFINPIQVDFNSAVDPTGPPGCDFANFAGQAIDSNGNVVVLPNGNDSFCIMNPAVAGAVGSDGIPDGFVDPIRKYRAVEFEVNKSMSKGWLLRANYRIAKLEGNYEGTFRNDNGQNDPNISSLFDFTQGDFKLLGQQFVPGVLNTDVHHLANGFVSYTFGGNHLKGLTMGSGVHFQTGTPINNLYAHPAYQNAGEVPFCADETTNCASARGALGRTKNWGSVDYHVDYPIRITEGSRIRLGADLFNITNMRTQLRVDQFKQSRFGVGNADFGKPTGIGPSAVNGNTNPGYQRPFYARLSAKFEF